MGDWDFHCGILGVAVDADEQEIRAAYRETAKLIHPDRHQQSEVAKRRFQQLNVSYKYLLDEVATKEMPRPQPPVAARPTGLWRYRGVAVGAFLVLFGVILGVSQNRFFPSPSPKEPAESAALSSADSTLSLSPTPAKNLRKKRAR
jgi:preprotein translocase subunit Sec63